MKSSGTNRRWLIGIGIILTILLLMVVHQHFFSLPQQQQNAGGSATGNALKFTQSPPPADSSISPSYPHALQETSQSAIFSLPPKDSLQTLQHFLDSHQITFKRAFQIDPQADLFKAKPGLMGPAYPDVMTIPGGVQPGDLLLYRQGLYQFRSQFPARSIIHQKTNNVIYLMAWPHETIRVKPGLLDTHEQNLRLIGFAPQ